MGFVDGATPAMRAAALGSVPLRDREALPVPDAAVVRLGPGISVPRAVERLEARAAIAWAEPNVVFRRSVVPNDPAFAFQWGLANVGQAVEGRPGVAGADVRATAAWDRTVGSPAVRVAVVDGGVDAGHPDLAPSVANGVNPGETGGGREGNGVDDDGNGLVDDWRGWDFHDGDNDPGDQDEIGHGTHVASVIGARGNDGFGIAGVAWQMGLIPVRAMSTGGLGTAVDVAAALAYAAARGARVVNVSLGSSTPSRIVTEAIAAAPNTLFVVAAGNDGDDLEEAPTYPCALTLANVVCVTATDERDGLPVFANFGAKTVHIGAPGVGILGALPGGGHQLLSGSSFAAPYVSGAAALVLAAHPAASTAQLRTALLASADPRPGLAGRVVSGGRLNIAAALVSVPPAAPGPAVFSAAAAPQAGAVRLAGLVTPREGPAAYFFEYGPTPAYGSTTPTRPLAPALEPTEVSELVPAPAAGAALHYRLVAADVAGITYGPGQVLPGPPGATTPTAPAAAVFGPAAVPPEAPPGSAAAAGPGAMTGRSAAAPPRIAVRRRGARWFLSLRLGAASVVTGRLERRRPARAGTRGAGGRYASVRGLRRRGHPLGERRFPLGRLGPGRYRVTVEVRSGAGRSLLVRAFRVPATAKGG